LLGAGASKPEPSLIPTVKELLPQLLERARRLDRDDVTRLADYCDERKIDNIEDLLTAAQLATFCSRTPTVLRLMNYLLYRRDADEPSDVMYYEEYLGRTRMRRPEVAADVSSVAFLQDTLQVLFGLLASTMLPARPNECHQAIVEYTSNDRGAAIVTTNYDCLIDMALEEGKRPLDYRIAFANVPEAQGNGAGGELLIKLHGSLNWYYCETCQEVQRVDIAQMIKQYMRDASPYPVIGICKQCGGQRRGLLVPPLAMKFDLAPSLTPLQQEAQQAFERADVIVVVGYSFAEADIYISRMLSKSMQTKPEQRLVVVDPDTRIVSRLRRKFKASIPGFDTTRLIRASEDCVKFMPGFLRGEWFSADVARAAPGRQGRKGRQRK
jgi:NAD-dependent SIR2 family protein deacetylase